MDGQGLLKVIDALGQTLAQLEQENLKLRALLTEAAPDQADPAAGTPRAA